MGEINKNYIEYISIQGFRGFKEKEKINFAYPDNEKNEKSGLNILVGQNCSGKSTILEVIKLLMTHIKGGYYLSKSMSDSETELEIEMKNTDCITTAKIDNRKTFVEINTTKDEGKPDDVISSKNYFLVPSRKNVVSNNLYNNSDNIENFVRSYNGNNSQYINRRNSNLNNEFISVLTAIYSDQNKKKKFDEILNKFLEDIEWNLYMSDEQENAFVVNIKDKCGETFFDGVGDGVITIIYICVGLLMLEENLVSVLLIDEPEVSLHPEVIKKIGKVISEYSYKYQIIISTHSPYLIDWDSIKSGGKLIRTVNDKRIQVYELDNSLIKCLEMNPSNNPHLYATTAKEVFFLKDNIILVEGQEDVVCYNKILKEISRDGIYNFYGWGAGGASNIKNLMGILNSMGYKKVVGIFDGDDAGEKQADVCSKEFEGEYLALNIKMEDIRDKYKTIYDIETLEKIKDVLEKEGILDDKFKIKDNFEEKHKADMLELFDTIDKYFEE